MNKENIIKKWLDNDLSPEELVAFQQMEEYNSFKKIADHAQWFTAPKFDKQKALNQLQPIIKKKGVPKTLFQKIKPAARIAAVVVLGLFVYSLIFTKDFETIKTEIAEKQHISLPDASSIQLNAVSELKYLKKSWELKREVKLNGEAYFKVASGSKFDVITEVGTVTVVGTEFNVKHRGNLFEVFCYEGKVRVRFEGDSVELTEGDTFSIYQKETQLGVTEDLFPSWIEGVSKFNSTPYQLVLEEFERQYNLNITSDVDGTALFTGTFVHDDLDLALLAITLPFKLQFTKENNQIKLYY